jgi:UDP:flavonoid glycosyltransferase YjiC (YdhE family)
MRHGKVSPAMAQSTIEKLFNTPSLVENAQRLSESLRAAPGAKGAADLIAGLATQSSTQGVA